MLENLRNIFLMIYQDENLFDTFLTFVDYRSVNQSIDVSQSYKNRFLFR